MNGFASVVAALALLQAEPDAAPAPTPTPSATPTPTPTPTEGVPPSPPAPAGGEGRGEGGTRVRVDAAAERAAAERAAREFLDALAASDASRLAAAASDKFSFDGDTVAGRDAVRGRWRALLAGRAGPAPRIGTVELLPAAEAVARLGKPPARIAPLARPGAWVAIADVGARPVVLFLAREGGRMAVLGMHD